VERDAASKALQACRPTLEWMSAFAFYLARNVDTEIFEDNRKDLETAVESLSAMIEKPVSELAGLKVDILDKTAYCNLRREILLSDMADNLKKSEQIRSHLDSKADVLAGRWKFNEMWNFHRAGESISTDPTTPAMYVPSTISRDFSGTNDEVASKILAPLARQSEQKNDLSVLAARSERNENLSLFSSKSDRKADISDLVSKRKERLPFR
jgi:hypothetical protein